MNVKQQIQTEQYSFPYHHIPHITKTRVMLSRHWSFAGSWLAAAPLVADVLDGYVSEKDATHRHLDVGCGDGALIKYLSQQARFCACCFDGIDSDETAVQWARLLVPGASWSTKKIHELPDHAYDSISLVEVLEHIDPAESFGIVATIQKKLKFGAPLVVTVPSANKPTHPKHYRHFEKDDLRDELAKHFARVQVVGFEKPTFLSKVYYKLMHRRGFVLDCAPINSYLVRQLAKVLDDGTGGRLLAICE